MKSSKRRFFIFFLITMMISILPGCSGNDSTYSSQKDGYPVNPPDVSKIPNAVPKAEPLSKYGNPSSYEVYGKTYHALDSSSGYAKTGIASWYGTKFQGHRTSSGEAYNMYSMTAASKTLPLPTYVEVTNLQNGKQVIVKVNDRGPFHQNRIIDLSYAAARKLGMLPKGTALVEVKAINPQELYQNKTLKNVKPMQHPEIFIQVAAFTSEDNAKRLSNWIAQSIAEPVKIKQGSLNDKPLYRVQIGPIASIDLSDKIDMQLRSHGIHNPITIIQ